MRTRFHERIHQSLMMLYYKYCIILTGAQSAKLWSKVHGLLWLSNGHEVNRRIALLRN